jgi:hypothetical protein
MTTSWHVEEPLWEAYAAGRLDQVAAAGVDTHLTACARCQSNARGYVESLEPVWAAVSLDVARPRLPRVLRPLARLGVPDHILVPLAASDSLLLPWAVAVGAGLATALLAGLADVHQAVVFLLLAPLVPVLSVMAAYDATDSLRELAAATPYSKLRLALVRTTAALVFAVPVTLAVGLLVPGLQSLGVGWLVPGLGLTMAALVVHTWTDAWTAGGGVGLAWSLVVLATSRGRDVESLTTGPAQAAFAALALVMALAFVLRTTTQRLPGGAL